MPSAISVAPSPTTTGVNPTKIETVPEPLPKRIQSVEIKRKRRWASPKDVGEMLSLHKEGYSIRQIADKMGFGYATVRRYLLDENIEVRPMVEKKEEKDVEIDEIDKELDELEAEEPKPHKKLPIAEHDLDYEEEVSLSKPNTKVYVHKKGDKSNGLGILPIAILGIAGLVLGLVFLKGLFRPKGAPVQPPAKPQPAAEASPYPKGINIVS
jgi:predicted transcriptional regulator